MSTETHSLVTPRPASGRGRRKAASTRKRLTVGQVVVMVVLAVLVLVVASPVI